MPPSPVTGPRSEIEILFRRESGRLVSVLTRILGAHNLALAEDVLQEGADEWSVAGEAVRWTLDSDGGEGGDVLDSKGRSHAAGRRFRLAVPSEGLRPAGLLGAEPVVGGHVSLMGRKVG